MRVKRLIANKLCDCTLFQQSTVLLNASLSKILISELKSLSFTFTADAIRLSNESQLSLSISQYAKLLFTSNTINLYVLNAA